MDESTTSRWAIAARALLATAGAAVAAGTVDALTTPHTYLGSAFLGLSVLAWLSAALPAGILFAAAAALGRRPSPAAAAVASVTPWIAAGWFLAVVAVNVSYLASDTGPQALLFDAVSIVVAGALGYAVFRALRPRLARAGAANRLRGPGALVAVAAAGAILAAATWRGGVGGVPAPEHSAPPEAPNVVIVLIDTLRRDHLSTEGYDRATSPAFTEFAARGVRFPDFRSQSCYTKPAVASLLTSLYPSGHGVGHLRTILPEARTTLAESFHAAGWRTAKFVSNTIIGPEFGFAQGAEVFHTLPAELIPRTRLGYALFRLAEPGRAVPGVAQLAAGLRRIERRWTGTTGAEVLGLTATDVMTAFGDWRATLGGDPYFAYLHVMEPHAPYRPPVEAAERFPGPPLVDQHPPTVGLFLPYHRAEALPPDRREGMVRAYDAEIAALDETLGGFLVDLLERSGNGRRTVVAVTSDHGEEFYEHGGWGHGQSLYEEQLDVPLWIAGPGVPAGRVVRGPAQLIDIGPTLLELAGLTPGDEMIGRSLVPVLNADAPTPALEPEREHFAEIVYGDSYWARSLREGHWKAILSRLGTDVRLQLFDLEGDPGEATDLAAANPEIARGMAARIETLAAESAAHAGPAGTAEFDPVTRERLRALGYVE